jgi:hypothetical protein
MSHWCLHSPSSIPVTRAVRSQCFVPSSVLWVKWCYWPAFSSEQTRTQQREESELRASHVQLLSASSFCHSICGSTFSPFTASELQGSEQSRAHCQVDDGWAMGSLLVLGNSSSCLPWTFCARCSAGIVLSLASNPHSKPAKAALLTIPKVFTRVLLKASRVGNFCFVLFCGTGA